MMMVFSRQKRNSKANPETETEISNPGRVLKRKSLKSAFKRVFQIIKKAGPFQNRPAFLC
jgi:hypothetical protein